MHPAYLEIQAPQRAPRSSSRPQTDNLKCYARDPLDLCKMFPIASAALATHLGLRLNQSKSAILLAAGQADLDPADVPDGVVLKRDGTSSVLLLALTSSSRITFWPLCGRMCARSRRCICWTRSLRCCCFRGASLVLGYHLQVTPPRLALTAAQAWDAAVDAARLRIASDPALGDVVRWWARHC